MSPQSSFDEQAEAEQRVGRTLRGKWHLDALLDTGGMAAVYAATHRNGLRGAVKILHPYRSADPDIAARFRREGYIANKVAHPNAVQVLDDDIDEDGSVFLVMELLEGMTLSAHAATFGGKLPPERVLRVMDPLLDVLAVAHDQGIVHRDIKPENVFLTSDGHVKVLDFGIAGILEASPDRRATAATNLPMGSPAFMAPEQARGRWDLVDAQSDVWSVGATMFTLLTGQIIHEVATVQELLAAVFTQPVRPVSTVVGDLHPLLAEVVDRALRLKRSERWPDVRAMREAVREAYLAMTGAPLPAGTLQDAEAPIVRVRPVSLPDAPTQTAVSVSHRRLPRIPRMPRTLAALSAPIAFAVVASVWSASQDAHSQPSVHAGTAAVDRVLAAAEPAPELPVDSVPVLATTIDPPAVLNVSVAPPHASANAGPRVRSGAAAPSAAYRKSLFDRRF